MLQWVPKPSQPALTLLYWNSFEKHIQINEWRKSGKCFVFWKIMETIRFSSKPNRARAYYSGTFGNVKDRQISGIFVGIFVLEWVLLNSDVKSSEYKGERMSNPVPHYSHSYSVSVRIEEISLNISHWTFPHIGTDFCNNQSWIVGKPVRRNMRIKYAAESYSNLRDDLVCNMCVLLPNPFPFILHPFHDHVHLVPFISALFPPRYTAIATTVVPILRTPWRILMKLIWIYYHQHTMLLDNVTTTTDRYQQHQQVYCLILNYSVFIKGVFR